MKPSEVFFIAFDSLRSLGEALSVVSLALSSIWHAALSREIAEAIKSVSKK